MTAQARWDDDRRRYRDSRTFVWPPPESQDVTLPILFVRVTTPGDQSALHRMLGERGYYPHLYGTDDDGTELWRFTLNDRQLSQ